jgi:uncharacterized membrane protein
MKTSTFGIKIWRGLSVMAVAVVLAYGYSLLPQEVAIEFDAQGKASNFVAKSQIFYIIFGFMIFNNVLLIALGRRIAELPVHQLPIPNQQQWASSPNELSEHILNWVYCIVAAINTIITVTVGVLATVNNEFRFKIGDFTNLIYFAVLLLAIVVVALPIRLMQKPSEIEIV